MERREALWRVVILVSFLNSNQKGIPKKDMPVLHLQQQSCVRVCMVCSSRAEDQFSGDVLWAGTTVAVIFSLQHLEKATGIVGVSENRSKGYTTFAWCLMGKGGAKSSLLPRFGPCNMCIFSIVGLLKF